MTGTVSAVRNVQKLVNCYQTPGWSKSLVTLRTLKSIVASGCLRDYNDLYSHAQTVSVHTPASQTLPRSPAHFYSQHSHGCMADTAASVKVMGIFCFTNMGPVQLMLSRSLRIRHVHLTHIQSKLAMLNRSHCMLHCGIWPQPLVQILRVSHYQPQQLRRLPCCIAAMHGTNLALAGC